MFQLRAAEGWSELGNQKEALAELERLGRDISDHEDVLEIYCRIYEHFEDWFKAMHYARRLREIYPGKPAGWIHEPIALHRQKLKEEAFALGLAASAKFPENATVAYNLACYAVALNKLEEARNILKVAVELDPRKGKPGDLREAASRDPDLIPLWENSKEP
ncbi:MAG: tetratricopeptide repeat protein [Verrucomicrobiota bacterium]|nr:tetratricopeptide repeat protein [Verrucomicrobiota bacterium]